MHYREFGELEWKPSALGFGAMRLPTKSDDSGDIDEEEAIKMIRWAFDHGVNYIDTAWPYHSGESEKVVGKALKKGYRKKVKVATKLPSWEIEEKEDPDKYLNQQLEKLQVDHIDFYLLHALSRKHWKNYQKVDILDWLEKKKEEGKIRYIGFSFHDDYDIFKKIVDSYSWDFCQIQYNYLDQNYQAGTKGLKYATSQGLGVIIMEPLRGGILAREPLESIKKIWEKSDRNYNPVGWALRWLWNQPEVSLVLSGMSTMDQVKENVKIAGDSGIDKLTQKDIMIIDEVAETYRNISPVDCTGCNYCVPCPNDVAIPTNFDYYNMSELYDEYSKYRERYQKLKEKEKAASSCIKCGKCEEKCPQNLPIMELLEETAEYFER